MYFINEKLRYLSSQLIKPRRYNYSQQSLQTYLQKNQQIKHQHLMIKNKRNESLDTIIFRNSNRGFKNNNSDTCILYAHGLGSNKIQVLPLVEFCKTQGFHLCAWDFSGSGRSQGEFTTYGIREQDDINAILGYLDSTRQYNRYILWGRSMGGTSIILSQSRNINRKVQCIILDSPFSSFEKAAIEIASRATNIPQIMLNFMIEPLKQQMKKQYSGKNLNPFDINICEAIKNIDVRVMVIYSTSDTVVNCWHSKEISKYCPRNTVQLEIQEDHNKPRKKQTYSQALKFIQQSIQLHESRARKRSHSKGRGISISSKQNICSNSKPRTSISITSSVASNKNNIISNNQMVKRDPKSFNNTQKFVSIGSFMSSSSRDMSNEQINQKKEMCIKSVLLDGINRRDNIRNSVKFSNINKYKNYVKLL